MNKISFLALSVCFTLSLSAQTADLQLSTPVNKQLSAKNTNRNVSSVHKITGNITEETVVLDNGLKIKTVKGLPESGKSINPERMSPSKVKETPEGYNFYEDFEEWDGEDAAWLPEGWIIDHKNSPVSDRGWKMTQPLSLYDYIDSKCLTYEVFEDEVDEWAITPEISVSRGMELRWSTMTSPYFYDWSYLNNTTFQLDKYEIINDIKVNISIDGGQTWATVFSHAQDLIDTAPSFFAMFDYRVRPFVLSLNKYAGQKIKVGFQIVGHGGNTTFIDDVAVGLPLTDTSYKRPLSNLYFGICETDEFVPASIMAGPVFAPVTYTNMTSTAGAKFEWSYSTGDDLLTSSDKNLTVSYHTDYTSDFTTRNNLYEFPVLRAWSTLTAPVDFTYPGFYQAGGCGEYERYFTNTEEYEIINLGLTVADPFTEGTATYADIILPYFGYNHESDRYWSDYSFGDYADENNWAHLVKIADFFYTPNVPLVIDGVHTLAYGKISRDAVLTAEIYLIDGGFVVSDTPYATAICTGEDIGITDRYSGSDLLSLNFKFDKPIVMTKEVAQYFIVAIGGFHDADNVEYFSPEMSAYSNPNNLGLGWVGKELCLDGTRLPLSWSPVANHTDDELVSFYIMLDAHLPWLESETDVVTVCGDDTNTEVSLDSYYPASSLQVDGLPDWISSAEITGRYGDTKLTLSPIFNTNDTDKATITIHGPGVSKQITLESKASSVTEIPVDDSNAPIELYTLDGRRVSGSGSTGLDSGASNLAPGIYIKRQGSTSTKVRL